MIIRRALVTDLFELSRLWLGMVKEAEPTLSPDLEMWRGYVVGLMKYQGYFMFVAEEENSIVGFIDYAMQPEPGKGKWVAMINFFYVLPEFRSIVAGKLWQAAIESAKENNAVEFTAMCFPSNLEFWEGHGFERFGYTIRRVI